MDLTPTLNSVSGRSSGQSLLLRMLRRLLLGCCCLKGSWWKGANVEEGLEEGRDEIVCVRV